MATISPSFGWIHSFILFRPPLPLVLRTPFFFPSSPASPGLCAPNLPDSPFAPSALPPPDPAARAYSFRVSRFLSRCALIAFSCLVFPPVASQDHYGWPLPGRFRLTLPGFFFFFFFFFFLFPGCLAPPPSAFRFGACVVSVALPALRGAAPSPYSFCRLADCRAPPLFFSAVGCRREPPTILSRSCPPVVSAFRHTRRSEKLRPFGNFRETALGDPFPPPVFVDLSPEFRCATRRTFIPMPASLSYPFTNPKE